MQTTNKGKYIGLSINMTQQPKVATVTLAYLESFRWLHFGIGALSWATLLWWFCATNGALLPWVEWSKAFFVRFGLSAKYWEVISVVFCVKTKVKQMAFNTNMLFNHTCPFILQQSASSSYYCISRWHTARHRNVIFTFLAFRDKK